MELVEYIKHGYEPAEWKSFLEQIEEALCKWGLSNDLCSKSPSWNKSVVKMGLGSYRISLTRYWISGISGKGESSDADRVEMPKAWLKCKNKSDMFPWDDNHNLQSCYGLEDFIVMKCSHEFGNPVRIEFLAEALLRTARDIGCQIPMFVHIKKEYASFHDGAPLSLREMEEMDKHESLGVAKISKKQIYTFIDREEILQDATDLWRLHWEDLCSVFYLEASWLDLQEIGLHSFTIPSRYPLVDLDLLSAHKWTVLVDDIAMINTVRLDCLNIFLNLCSSTQTESLLSNPQISSMLKYRRIYKRRENISEVNSSLIMQGLMEHRKATSKLILNTEESHIPVETLNSILDLLFSDVKLQKDHHSNGGNLSSTTTVEDEVLGKLCFSYKELSQYFKSAQLSSLIGRLAVCMCIVSKYHGGIGAVNQLWGEFVLEMKYCLENNCEIKGLESKGLNMDYPELLKKLQVLNGFIEKRKARDASSPIIDPTDFERFTETLKIKEVKHISDLDKQSINKSEASSREDVSRRGSMLIDRLSYAKVFLFANPGYTIADFLKWCISEIITDKDNPNQWIRILDEVFHKDAQTQSFRDDDEAAEVLHWLATLKPSDLVIGLMPVLINLVIDALLDKPESKLDFLEEYFNQIKVPQCNSSNRLKEFEDVVKHLILIVEKLRKTRFLLKKFRHFDPTISVSDHELEHFVAELVEFSKASIPTSGSELPSHTNLGKIVYKYLSSIGRIDDHKELNSDEAAQVKVIKPDKRLHIFKINFSDLPRFVIDNSRLFSYSDKFDIMLDKMFNKEINDLITTYNVTK